MAHLPATSSKKGENLGQDLILCHDLHLVKSGSECSGSTVPIILWINGSNLVKGICKDLLHPGRLGVP